MQKSIPRSCPPEATDAELRARRMLEKLARSGRALPEFARSHAIKPETLTWWKYETARRERARAARRRPQSDVPALLPVRVLQGERPVRVVAEERTVAAQPFEVVLACGRTIRVPSDFDRERLLVLLAVVEGVPC